MMWRRHILSALCAVLLAALATLSMAQVSEDDRAYYNEWLEKADRAEDVIDANTAPNAALEQLRSELAGYREAFTESRTENTDRIRTLQSQISALGGKPEDGDEPQDIADLRETLTLQLSTMQVPRVVSEEAFNRANGLIGEIDRIIRERQAKKLLARGPSPLDPLLWPIAFRDINNTLVALVSETVYNLKIGTPGTKIRDNLPAILVLLLLGCVLLIRGSNWSERFGDYLRAFGGGGAGVWSFLVSLTKIILPLIGLILVTQAVSLTGLLGLRGTHVLEAIPGWGTTFLAFNWLGYQLTIRREELGVLSVSSKRASEIRFYVVLLATMLVVRDAIHLFEQIENISEASRAVVGFLPILLTALILLRLQRVALRRRKQADDASEETARRVGFSKMVPMLQRTVVALGLLSPVLAAAGYGYAAEAIVYPAVHTLALIALVLIFQRFIGDLYGWISGKGDAARDSLFTVLVGFVLVLASLPLLALTWGARVADLTELWTQFLEGFVIGETRVSPIDFVTFVMIFLVCYAATRLLQGGLRNSLLPKTSIDPGAQNAIVSGTGYVGITLAALVAVAGTGLDLSSLAIVAGALSVGIGFGLQTIVSNFVSGIILLIERPISKGDWIEVGGLMGYVRDISVRSTRIETFDRTDVIVPNSDLISGTVTNYTRGNTIGRVIAPVGVAYGTDTKRVEQILSEIANAHPMVLANPPPNIVFQGFGESSLDFEIRAILRDVNWVLSVRSDMNHEIAKRFADEGIEIPFAQRDLWLRNPEALPGAAAFTPSARHNFYVEPKSEPAHKDKPDDT